MSKLNIFDIFSAACLSVESYYIYGDYYIYGFLGATINVITLNVITCHT